MACRPGARTDFPVEDRTFEEEPFEATDEPQVTSNEVVPDWSPSQKSAAASSSMSLSWEYLGPSPVALDSPEGSRNASGRVAAITVHPTDPNTVYVASASGGVWKTVDHGLNWLPLTDELSTLNHGCVALDPSAPDTIYVGTGEYLTGLLGDGLFRSIDGGSTWARLATASEVGTRCSQIIVDPTDPMRIHVTGDIGYVRSDDGGATWTTHLPADASDMVMQPNDPSILYVGHVPDGIYRSVDSGDTWVHLTNGLPATQTANVVLDIAQSNPDVLYAVIVAAGSSLGIEGVFRSGDGGDTWTQTTGIDPALGRTLWNLALGIDTSDEDTVYLLGFNPYRTQNAGASWNRIEEAPLGGVLHVDHQAIAFGPDGTLWMGNDGGVWRSSDGAQTWINVNGTLGITQFYSVAFDTGDPERFMGGSQDNGIEERSSGGLSWSKLMSGDGGACAIDPSEPLRRYSTAVAGQAILRYFGDTITNITGVLTNEPHSGATPLVLDPNDAHTLLYGTDRVWRAVDADAGANWEPISEVFPIGAVTALAVAEGFPNSIYAGTNTGRVYATSDTLTWTEFDLGLGFRWVNRIDIDPNDPQQACLAIFSNVLCTDDQGVTWADMTGTFPTELLARTLAVDWNFAPPVLYVGTGVGIYASDDMGVSWMKDGPEFPNVIVSHLSVNHVNRTLLAGTYGRGAWRASLPDPPPCGDGMVGVDETCDIAIPAGSAGACPSDCANGDPCIVGTLSNPGTCVAECTFVTVTDLVPDDGCCPAGATRATDNDCLFPIPAVSTWGLSVIALLLLVSGSILIGNQRFITTLSPDARERD